MTRGAQQNITEISAASPNGGNLGLIRISARAEAFISQLGDDLVSGRRELWQLSPALLQFWEFAYSEGAASRQRELDLANNAADRYYSQLFCPRVNKKQGATFAELEQIRHDIYYKNDAAGSQAA